MRLLSTLIIMDSQDANPQRILAYIMLAVLAWGAVLAFGAYLYGGTRQGIKAAVIFGCVAAFLGFWALLLRWRGRRKEE